MGRGGREKRAYRAAGLVVALAALGLVVLVSVWVGDTDIPFTSTARMLVAPDGSTAAVTIREVRLPRTVLGLLVGTALGLAGAVMQSLTRNPLADPGCSA